MRASTGQRPRPTVRVYMSRAHRCNNLCCAAWHGGNDLRRPVTSSGLNVSFCFREQIATVLDEFEAHLQPHLAHVERHAVGM
eukprot:NODE_24953_length_604_cov_4.635220.p1 GENE.NODE_24953_length_604_cov_4.635220~~NODE_24953_length_604_cov_4.635220.p1  ORF type:complete len:82 (+),score=6.69 NODE_24953_length_604_cov_4.635220:122-367(+)